MSVNFFNADCRIITRDKRFGICDDDNKKPAYTNTDTANKWIATVVNDAALEINFTAIDNCIDIFRDNGEMESRCDVMMAYQNSLLFVELKTKRKNWKAEGLGQIEATIQKMLDTNNDYYYGFKKRKAIVANSKHKTPCFEENDAETRIRFFREFKIRLQFNAEIVIN